MATSGSVETNQISRSHFYVDWSQSSQSIANNTTTITWKAGLYTGTSSAHDEFYRNAVKLKSVVINGTTVYSNGTFSNITSGGKNQLASGTLDIPHNSDGTKSFSISVSGWTYSNSNYSGSDTFTLNSIPRQATITNAPDFNDEQNPTITYSNPAGNNVTTLRAYIQNTAGTVTYVQYKNLNKTGTSYTFNLTDAERDTLRSACSNSNTLGVKFVVETILGGNTFNSTVNKTMTIVNANPLMNSVEYEDTNATTTAITDSPAVIIRNNSTLAITVGNIWAYKQATLVSLTTNINGVIQTTSLSGSHETSVLVDFGTINVSSDITAVLTATDSRGNKYTYNLPITVWDWVLPTAIITCQRQNNYYSETDINVNADYSSLDNKNQITIQYQYKKTTDSSYSALANLQDDVTTTFNIDNNYQWNVRVIVTDLLGSTTYNLFVDKGIPIVYFDRLNNSTGFNCFPQNQGSTEIDGDLIINSQNINDMLTGVGGTCKLASSDWNTACNNTTGFFMGDSLANSPSGSTVGGWWWVINLVHNENYQRQIAFSFLNNDGIYTRMKNNGSWNSWTQV